MHIKKIRNIIDQYKMQRGWLSYFFENGQFAILKSISENRRAQPDSYTLTDTEIYAVASTLIVGKQDFLNNALIDLFDSKIFIELLSLYRVYIKHDIRAFSVLYRNACASKAKRIALKKYMSLLLSANLLNDEMLVRYRYNKEQIDGLEYLLAQYERYDLKERYSSIANCLDFYLASKLVSVVLEHQSGHAKSILSQIPFQSDLFDIMQIKDAINYLSFIKNITTEDIIFCLNHSTQSLIRLFDLVVNSHYAKNFSDIFSRMVREENRDVISIYIRVLVTSFRGGYFSDEFSKKVMQQSVKLTASEQQVVLAIFEFINEFDQAFSEKQIHAYFKLSLSDKQSLAFLVKQMKQNKYLVEPESFQILMQRVAQKNVNANISTANLEWSSDHINKEVISIKDKKFYSRNASNIGVSGSYGFVSKLFASNSVGARCYALKEFNRRDYADEGDLLKCAKREVKYNRLLNRSAWFFKYKKSYAVIMDWQRSHVLDEVKPAEYKSYPIIDRIQCLLDGARDINKLHERYRVHFDIKPNNFIINLKEKKLNLIDFNGAHKQGYRKKYCITKYYDDHETRSFNYDMFLYSNILATIMPEIFEVVYKESGFFVMSGKLSDSDCLYNSMIYLYHAMRSSSAKSRCTALDIIKYCEKLIKCADSLDDAMLIKISDSTIRRQAVTQEDIMRHARYEQFAHI